MRYYLIAFLLLLLSSCSLFKGSVKKKTFIDSTTTTVLSRTAIDIDTSETSIIRKWKFTFDPSDKRATSAGTTLPCLGTTDMKKAMQNLKKAYNKLPGQNPIDSNLFFYKGYDLTSLELEEQYREKLGKSSSDTGKDSTLTNLKKSGNETEKEPINPWLVLGCVSILVLAIYLFFKK